MREIYVRSFARGGFSFHEPQATSWASSEVGLPRLARGAPKRKRRPRNRLGDNPEVWSCVFLAAAIPSVAC